MSEVTKRDFRRRAAVKPVIGHCKSDHHTNRNFLAQTSGDAANAVLAAAGYNCNPLLHWLGLLCALILAALLSSAPASLTPKAA